MEVSFKFNAGESGSEMVAAILALFGASQVPQAVVAGVSGSTPQAVINPADNPAAGGDDGHDAGPASNQTHDAEGCPWDARIHSEKRTVTDKGLWRKRKGVPPNAITAVMNELRSQGKIATVTQQAAVALPTPPAAVPGTPPAAIVPPAGPATLPPMGMPAMPPLAPAETAYSKFVNFVATNMQSATNPAGKFYDAWIEQALRSYGHVGPDGQGSIQTLEHAGDDRIKQVHAAFTTAIGATV